jgi:hypothetical protein
MARRRTTHVDADTLERAALDSPHRFQRLAVRNLIGFGWKVSSVNRRDGVHVVVMRMISDSKIGTAVYPNGAFARKRDGGTIQWDWNRARDTSYATIPDPYVADIIKAQEELAKV